MADPLMSGQVVIILGPPGSGKDTQAFRLVEEYGMLQVPSSKIIRQKFAENPDDPVIKREKERYDSGYLTDPVMVAGWVMEFVRPLAAQGVGLVFSGSPRRPPEAEIEFTELPKMYGDRNVRVFRIQLSEDEARRRIAGRRFCTANNHPIPAGPEFDSLTTCPKDGSPLQRRNLDDAEFQDKRFQEYQEQTVPCFAIAEQHGVPVFELDGTKSIEAIHHEIVDIIERHKMPAPLS
jgi:adenylate kinase